ncbi:MAG: C45 family autoproteolytic acyltransferase/hydrolase [Burkholderiaceae bacterium]
MRILPRSTISGSAFEIGEQLGQLSKPVLEKLFSDPAQLRQIEAWKSTLPLDEMMAQSSRHFPECWEELRGISSGCGIELDDIYLWNCRPDLAKTVYDSSATVAVNRLANRFIVQEILEQASLQPYCRIVEVAATHQPAFLALYIPGMLPGISFSTSRAGLVQSINLLDTPANPRGVPSTFIARAVLQRTSLLEALEILTETPRMGGAHHVLAWAGEFIMLSVEATAGKVSIVPISNKYAHTNHTLHAEQADSGQASSASSRARYTMLLDELRSIADHPEEDDVLAWIRQGHDHLCTSTHAEETNRGLTVLFRCVSKKISVQLFNANRSGTQKFSFSINNPKHID